MVLTSPAAAFKPPPTGAHTCHRYWIVLVMLPISCLFTALCIALVHPLPFTQHFFLFTAHLAAAPPEAGHPGPLLSFRKPVFQTLSCPPHSVVIVCVCCLPASIPTLPVPTVLAVLYCYASLL